MVVKINQCAMTVLDIDYWYIRMYKAFFEILSVLNVQEWQDWRYVRFTILTDNGLS